MPRSPLETSPAPCSSASVKPRPRRCFVSESHDFGAHPTPNRAAASASKLALGEEPLPGLGRGGRQLLGEELRSHAVRVEQPHPVRRVLGGAAVLVGEPEPDPGREPLGGLHEGDVVELHQEGVDVAALAAAEAVEPPDPRTHVEAGAALVVEGAEALQRADAGGLESDLLADDVGDVRPGPDLLDVARADAAGHAESLGFGADATGRAPGCRPGVVPGRGAGSREGGAPPWAALGRPGRGLGRAG